MDVLAYSAFNQQVQLNQQIVAKTSCLATKCSETAALQGAAASFSPSALCWIQCIEPCLLRCPFAAYSAGFACCIPDITATSGIKVCRCSGNSFFNYGACCLWTVPAGATRARFQIWGAGGGGGAGCCCGGSPFGSTGAYASVIIPVTAGCSYTLCAGCASQSRACSSSPGGGRIPGCPSWVTGPGLCNFCANGGQGRISTWMSAYGRIRNCRIGTIGHNYCGPEICNVGIDYCSSGCFNTGGTIPHVAGASYFGTTTSTTTPSIVYGIRGMWPCLFLFNYGGACNVHPPVYGFASTSCCTAYYNSTCTGINNQACCGVLNIPSAGAWASAVFSGCNTACGDWGRGGMVCVSWC